MIPKPPPLPLPETLPFEQALRFQEAVPALEGVGLQVLYAPGKRVHDAFVGMGDGPFGSFLLAHAGPSSYEVQPMKVRQRAVASAVADIVSFRLGGPVDKFSTTRIRLDRVAFAVVDLMPDRYCGLSRATILDLFGWMHECPPLTKNFTRQQKLPRQSETRELKRAGTQLHELLERADGTTLRRWVLRRMLAQEMERNW